jgi:hypothetical protein
MGSNLKIKELFFDRDKVVSAYHDGRGKVLSHIGAFIRQRMKSITSHRSSGSAQPGQPPKRHIGHLHDLIFFAAEPDHGGVVIGPLKFTSAAGEDIGADVLEHGGDETIVVNRAGRKKLAHFHGNPFAAPSLKAEIAAGTIPAAFSGCVRG